MYVALRPRDWKRTQLKNLHVAKNLQNQVRESSAALLVLSDQQSSVCIKQSQALQTCNSLSSNLKAF